MRGKLSSKERETRQNLVREAGGGVGGMMFKMGGWAFEM